MSNFLKRTGIDKLVASGVSVIAALGFTACSAEKVERDQYGTIPGNKVEICNGARVRDEPRVPGKYDDDNLLAEVNFGDAPDETCVKIPVSVVYIKDSDNNGPWYGIVEAEASKGLPKITEFNKTWDNIVWINNQRASVENSNDTQ